MNPIPIIMPVKDRLDLTKQTIDSLFRETSQPFKLIVVSDESTDETNNYLKSLDGDDFWKAQGRAMEIWVDQVDRRLNVKN